MMFLVSDRSLGTAQGFTLTARFNQLPVISSTNPPTGAIPEVEYAYDAIARDPDGGKLTYEIDTASIAKGISIDNVGRLRWTPTKAQQGIANVTITVKDEADAAVTQILNINVQPDTTAPTVKIGFAGLNPATLGSRVIYQVQATDNVKLDNIELTINGKPVILNQDGQIDYILDTPGVIKAVAKATDSAGNVKTDSFSIDVFDPAVPQNAPEVRLDLNLIPNGTITNLTEIRGLVRDPDNNLSRYRLEVAPIDTENWITMFEVSGTEVASGKVLGNFDPTIIDDGIYRVKLTATDTTSIVNSTEGQIEVVSGNLKLGEFQLSFTDMSINAGNLPVQLTRTYDTLKINNRYTDLAPGWSVEFRDVDLRTSLGKPDPFYEELGIPDRSRGLKVGNKIYLTIGGKREVFEVDLKPAVREGLILSLYGITLFDPIFKPVGSTKSKMTLSNYQSSSLTFRPRPDGIIGNLAGVPYDIGNPYFGSKLVVTSETGIQYEIDPVNGKIDRVGKDLYNISRDGRVKANANPSDLLELTDSYIKSSYGAQITFERDSKGRIIAATDPSDKQVKYVYDAKGDLTAVIDRENNTTQFKYAQPTRNHFLTEIIDPLGRSGIKTEYNDKGQLISMVDALGKSVALAYDPTNSKQTVTDALGNPTTYVYDTRGNVVSELDALGGLIARTYDNENNLLSEIDQEGRTKSYEYDNQGNLLSQTDGLGNISRYTYGANRKILTSIDPLGNATKYTLDSRGNVLSKIDAEGNTTNYTYDLKGNPLSITDPNGGVTSYTYNLFGNRTRMVDPLGNEFNYTYDAKGNQLTETYKLTTPSGVRTLTTNQTFDRNDNVTSVTDAEGNISRFEYNAGNKRIASIDPLGRRTESNYDEKGQLTSAIFNDGKTNSYTYDAKGDKTSSTDREGRTSFITYDALGKSTQLIAPDNTSNDLTDNARKLIAYDRSGLLKSITDERGTKVQYTFDAAGNIISVTNALGDTLYNTYDPARRKISTTDALGRTTRYTYDALGRQIEVIYPDRTIAKTVYDPLNNVIAKIDQAGNKTQYEYDKLNHLTAVIDSLNQRTSYGYDELGDLIRQTDANSHITKYEYDGLKRRIATVNPVGDRSEMSYDTVGNLVRMKDFNGILTTYEYDTNNLLIAKRFADGTSTTFTYTLSGKRKTETDARGTTTYNYDVNDLLTSRTEPDGTTVSYTYDRGSIISVTSSSGTIRYSYDGLGRLDTVTDASGNVTDYAYDKVGNLIETKLGNGITETRQYDNMNRLVLLKDTNATGTVLSSYGYTFDPVGNIKTVDELGGRREIYSYDALYRLTQESIIDPLTGSRTMDYGFDSVGNRLSKIDSLTGLTTYAYDAGDRLTTETNGSNVTTYGYDKNGNTLSQFKNASDQITYTWDYENRLKATNIVTATGTKQTTYRYDANGIRVGQTVDGVETRYLIDANRPYAQVLEEYNGSGIQATYVYGNSLISQSRSGIKSFYLQDGHSGVRKLTNNLGVVTDSYNYDAYGTLINSTGSTLNSYLYRGEQFDSGLNQYYLRARYYKPSLGRLSSVDPFEGDVMSPMSRHRFMYGNANPVTFQDPSGMFSIAELSVTDLILTSLIGTIVQNNVGYYVGKSSGNLSWEGYIASYNRSLSSVLTAKGIDFGLSGSISYIEASSEVIGNYQTEGTWLLLQIGYSVGLSSISAGGSLSTISLTSPKLFHEIYGGGLGGFVASLGGGITLPISNPPALSFPKYPNALRLSLGYGYGESTFGGVGFSIGVDLQTGVSIPVAYDPKFRNRTPT